MGCDGPGWVVVDTEGMPVELCVIAPACGVTFDGAGTDPVLGAEGLGTIDAIGDGPVWKDDRADGGTPGADVVDIGDCRGAAGGAAGIAGCGVQSLME